MVALRKLVQQQATATEATNDAINQLIDHIATYCKDGINYHAIGMVLAAHSDTSHINVRKAFSRAGAHIIVSEDVSVPGFNGLVLTIC